MNQNVKQTLEYYCENEVQTLKKHKYFAEIGSLANSVNYFVDISVGEAMDVKKHKYPKKIYLSFSVLDQQRRIVCVDSTDFEHLTDATMILEIDCKDRVKFFSWQEDKDFIESLIWITKELKTMQTRDI